VRREGAVQPEGAVIRIRVGEIGRPPPHSDYRPPFAVLGALVRVAALPRSPNFSLTFTGDPSFLDRRLLRQVYDVRARSLLVLPACTTPQPREPGDAKAAGVRRRTL
jgi:hypothetical protein